MAGHARDFPHIAHIAVDGRDHTQRQVQLVENRPLFNVQLDEAQVVRGVAFETCNACQHGFGAQPDTHSRVLHGLLHGHAIRIALRQPCGFEIAGQGARAQEGRFVALAFFFGKGHHFEVKRQTLAALVQCLHAGHRYKNTQPAVVFAAVADRVVMAAREQCFCVGLV